MDLSDFDAMLTGVADAFGKSVSQATKAQYYSLLGHLTDDQWRRTCESAKAECEQFPKISEMRKISYQFAPPQRVLSRKEPTVTVVCKCRNSWAWWTEAEYHQTRSSKCWVCNTTYEHDYLEQHREGCLIDLSGDAEEEKRQQKSRVTPEQIVAQLESQKLF